MAVPIVNMLSTFPAIWLVEKWGRKKLLYFGAVIMFISMLSAAIALQHFGGETKTILLIAVVFYIFGFAVSWGPIPWLTCSEIFPLKGREIGITITTMINWTFAGILMRYSLSFMDAFGKPDLFYLFSFFCIAAIIYVGFFVPETKGFTLEEIEKKLTAK